MSELLPTRQASDLQHGLLDYLATTFALADADVQSALREFLIDAEDGIFKGPYVRDPAAVRTSAGGGDGAARRVAGRVQPVRPPGGRVRQAAQPRIGRTRLAPAAHAGDDRHRLGQDRVLPVPDPRSRAAGQARRGATVPEGADPLPDERAGQRPGAATGPADHRRRTATRRASPRRSTPARRARERTKVTPVGLITDRDRHPAVPARHPAHQLQDARPAAAAPRRPANSGRQSADSLQYLVLDEFHTYDGAQGTDVAMLLRRLGLALKSHWSPRGSSGDTHTAEEWERPLGRITPVGTSATLGDKGDPAAMLAFAETVFGEPFAADSVITESRLQLDTWLRGPSEPSRRPRTGRRHHLGGLRDRRGRRRPGRRS